MKRRVISVRCLKDAALSWRVLDPGAPDPRDREVGYGWKKLAASIARQLAKDIVARGGRAQVRVFKVNGQIGIEWTYPRSSDPRRSRG
jgi:hypothetical protein